MPGLLLPLGPAETDTGVRLHQGLCGDLVPARIGGVLGWFQLDSGTYMHVLSPKFVERAHLPIDIGTEDSGPSPRPRIGVVDLVIPKIVRIEQPALAVARNDSMLGSNICDLDGLLAPALLARENEAIVVDYRARTVTTMLDDDLRATFGAHEAHFLATREEADYAPSIDVSFGGTRQRAVVDTGAYASFVPKTSPPGRALLPSSHAGGRVNRIDGQVGYREADVRLAFGTMERKVELLLTDPYRWDYGDLGGVLGMDALANCTLAFTRNEVWGACD